jgi:uncharacterized membrane protein
MENNKLLMPRFIFIILTLAVILNIARILIFHSTAHIYILWNIFLAFLPLVASYVLVSYGDKQKLTKTFLVIVGLVWLLLIPNAPYIVTDLIHIGQGRSVPAIFDSFVLFSSALAGLLMGMYSISQVEKVITIKYGDKASSLIITAVLLLISFGIYIGRFLRWNSWDVVTNPFSLYEDVKELIVYPDKYSDAFVYIGLFFVFMYMSYKAWKSKGK